MDKAALAWRCFTVTEGRGASSKWGQLLRYGVVGLASNLTGYCVYLLLTAFVLPPKITMTILYSTGALLGFIGNRRFTFGHTGKLPRAALRYMLAHFLGWAMNYALLYIFADRLGYPHQLVQAVAIAVVAGYLFVALRYFVFTAPMNEDGATP